MTFTLHVNWVNGGGAIMDKFSAKTIDKAIEKAESKLIDLTKRHDIKDATLNRCLKGQGYQFVSKWTIAKSFRITNPKT